MNIEKNKLIDTLLTWYDQNKRELPWRDKQNPYYIWISEIMLQQTQVKTVIPYFERFIKALPDIDALASVSEEKLNKLWEGLGYYKRAANLKKASQKIKEDYEGQMPETYEALLTLPGIGPYTAGAIASISFGERKAAIDGNLMRVFARLLELDYPSNTTSSYKAYETVIMPYLPAHRPGDFNQALMDIGAGICLAKSKPLCQLCPLKDFCQSYLKQTINHFPKKIAKKEKRLENRLILILNYNNYYYIEKKEENGVLKGLWAFTNLNKDQISLEGALNRLNLNVKAIIPLGDKVHIFTHIKWQMSGYCVILKDVAKNLPGQWVTSKNLEKNYSLPSAYKSFISSLEKGTHTLF